MQEGKKKVQKKHRKKSLKFVKLWKKPKRSKLKPNKFILICFEQNVSEEYLTDIL